MRRLPFAVAVTAAALQAACGALLTASDDPSSASSADAPTEGGSATAEGGSDGGVAGEVDAGRTFRVFFTSKQFTMLEIGANLDGLCESQLPPSLVGRRFVPWLSTTQRSARDAIKGDGPWLTLTGDVVAANRAALFGGTLANPIRVDELGVRSPTIRNIWTGTTISGELGPNCNDWKTQNQKVLLGSIQHVDTRWTALTSDPTCDSATSSVYCFESE